MKGLMLLADGFEDTEALSTRDVLIRGGIDMITCSVKNEPAVMSSMGIELYADTTYRGVTLDDYDFIVLPGGGGGTRILYTSEFVKDALKHFENKLMCAICAAPSVLGKYGYLNNKKFVCFPGFEDGIMGHYQSDGTVVVDGNIITARSMYYSIEFGLTILKTLLGEEACKKALVGMKGLVPKN